MLDKYGQRSTWLGPYNKSVCSNCDKWPNSIWWPPCVSFEFVARSQQHPGHWRAVWFSWRTTSRDCCCAMSLQKPGWKHEGTTRGRISSRCLQIPTSPLPLCHQLCCKFLTPLCLGFYMAAHYSEVLCANTLLSGRKTLRKLVCLHYTHHIHYFEISPHLVSRSVSSTDTTDWPRTPVLKHIPSALAVGEWVRWW